MTLAYAKRRAYVAAFLLSALDAGFSKSRIISDEPKKHRSKPASKKWRFLYGWWLELVPRKGSILAPDGRATLDTQFDVVKKFSHEPGQIIESRSRKRTNGDVTKYVVQTNHSLRRAA